MAYKWGVILTTYKSWDDPPSRLIWPLKSTLFFLDILEVGDSHFFTQRDASWWPHTSFGAALKVAFRKGNPPMLGKSRLVKYYTLG